MNILDKTDDEILEIAHPMWDDLIRFSNEKDYGKFTRHFSSAMMLGANEVEIGKQFARSKLTQNLSPNKEYLGMIRRGEHITVLYKQTNEKMEGEWLGRLVLGYEDEVIKIFGATLF